MAYFIKRGLTQDPDIDSSERIIGVNNGLPPSEIPATFCADAVNRLSVLDAINRGRCGMNRVVAVPGGVTPQIITYFGANLFLVTDGATLWTWNDLTLTLTQVATGLPFAPVQTLSPLNCALANTSAYFTSGGSFYKWSGSAFSQVALPAQVPGGVSFPVWYTNRMILAATGTNSLIWSDITNPENYGPLNNSTTVTTTLDNEPSDAITGMSGFQTQSLIVFKKAKIYFIPCPPATAVTSFSIVSVSKVIGCAEHNTIAQVGNDLMFLSESGYGIFKISVLFNQANVPNIGIGQKVSEPIKSYISRINWAVVNKARAVTWQDLYILSVAIDGSGENNALFVYSSALDAWQGIWNFNTAAGASAGIKSFGTNPSAPAGGSELLLALSDLTIGSMTRPDAKQYNDTDVGGAPIDVLSQFTTKAYRYGTKSNQVQPYSLLVNFYQSQGIVQIDGITDRKTQNAMWIGSSAGSQLNLPASLPWNLGGSGVNPIRANALKLGACRQVQYRLSGKNNWTVLGVEPDAFETRPIVTQ